MPCAFHVAVFFFNDAATSEFYPLSLQDAFPFFPPFVVSFKVTVQPETKLLPLIVSVVAEADPGTGSGLVLAIGGENLTAGMRSPDPLVARRPGLITCAVHVAVFTVRNALI